MVHLTAETTISVLVIIVQNSDNLVIINDLKRTTSCNPDPQPFRDLVSVREQILFISIRAIPNKSENRTERNIASKAQELVSFCVSIRECFPTLFDFHFIFGRLWEEKSAGTGDN